MMYKVLISKQLTIEANNNEALLRLINLLKDHIDILSIVIRVNGSVYIRYRAKRSMKTSCLLLINKIKKYENDYC